MKKTFDADEPNYQKLVDYCDIEGLKIGHVINAGISNFLVSKGVIKMPEGIKG